MDPHRNARASNPSATGALPDAGTLGRSDLVERLVHVEAESARIRYQLETIYDNIEAGLWITEVRPDGEFLWVYNNPAYQRLTGLDLRNPHGLRFEDIVSREAAEHNRRRCREVLETGRKVTYDDNFDVNGETRWLWNTLIPVRAPNGRIAEIVGTGIDVTDRRKVERAVLRAVEREQRRIGQDLHDGLLQQLSGILFMTQLLQRHLHNENNPRAQEAAEINQLLDEAVTQARRLSHGLFPAQVEKEGILSALRSLAETTVERSEIACLFQHQTNTPNEESDLRGDLGLEVETHLFRIAQESVANAVRHADANRIDIILSETDAQIKLTVQDNGRGIDEAAARNAGGIGLRSMQYRANLIAGTLHIQPRSDQPGAQIVCTLPRHNKQSRQTG